jgi:hypothetical protein
MIAHAGEGPSVRCGAAKKPVGRSAFLQAPSRATPKAPIYALIPAMPNGALGYARIRA